jgi:hypothetical protein
MRTRCAAVLTLVLCAQAALAQSQTPAQEPVGPFVVDARGLMAGLPTAAGWTPTVPAGTIVPSRGFGFDVGAHVYPASLGRVRLGLGAAMTFARGTAKAVEEGTPDVVTRSSTFAPQVSFNFGHRLGWSYLSLGYGAAKVSSEAAAVGQLLPAVKAEGSWGGALNYGGGARWFLNDRVGFGFDIRWHRLSGRDATTGSVAAPGATLFHMAVGVSVH